MAMTVTSALTATEYSCAGHWVPCGDRQIPGARTSNVCISVLRGSSHNFRKLLDTVYPSCKSNKARFSLLKCLTENLCPTVPYTQMGGSCQNTKLKLYIVSLKMGICLSLKCIHRKDGWWWNSVQPTPENHQASLASWKDKFLMFIIPVIQSEE